MKSEVASESQYVTIILPKVSVDGVAKVGLMESAGLNAKVLSLIKESRLFPTLSANIGITYLTRSEMMSRLRYPAYLDSIQIPENTTLLAHNISSAVMAFRLYKKYHCPYLAYIHDAEYPGIPGTRPTFTTEEINEAVNSAIAVTTNSSKTANQLELLYDVKGTPIYPGCISAIEFPEKKDNFVLAIHSIANVKSLDILYKLLEQDEKLNLVVAGGKRYSWQLVYAKFKIKFGKRITFVLNPSESDLTSLLARSRMLIHPDVENFGLSPLEAAGQGTPSVVARGSGILEVLREGKEVIAYDEGDLESLGRVLKSNSDYDDQTIGRNAWRRAQEFDWKRHLTLVRQALGI